MDTLANLLTILRNAEIAGKKKTIAPMSKTNKKIVEILKSEGFIEDYRIHEIDSVKKHIVIMIRKNVIHNLKQISKQSKRVYKQKSQIQKIKNGFGISIYSTPKGILTAKEARLANVGGELLLEVW